MTTGAATDPIPYVIYIGDRLIVCDERPGAQQCTAKTSKGGRCRNPLECSQITGWAEIFVPGWGSVSAYDLGGDFYDKNRWLAQRCVTHWPDGETVAGPDWQPFDPSIHASTQRERRRQLTWDSERKVVEYR